MSCLRRWNRSAGSEQRPLFVPCDRETELARETFGGQLDRVTVAQDRSDDLGREKLRRRMRVK